MKNDQLDHLLKSAAAPRRAEEYWDDFPRQITTALRRGREVGATSESPAPRFIKLQFTAWGVAFACVFVLLGFVLGARHGHAPGASADAGQMAEVKKYYREIEALFPNQVRAIAFDQQGPHLELSEQANVPRSPAFYLELCGPKGCESFVTFSGQKIKFGGEQFEVLADAKGEVIVVGDKRAWAGGNDSGPIRIQTKPLENMM